MTMINAQNLKEELEKLSHNDRQEIETFIGYLKSRSQKQITEPSTLISKVNEKLLEGYVKLTIDYQDVSEDDYGNEIMDLYFHNRERPIGFNFDWFKTSDNDNDYLFLKDLFNGIEELYVKFRPGTNKIDKVAIDSKYLSELGKKDGKRRILALNNSIVNIENIDLNNSVNFVKDIIVNKPEVTSSIVTKGNDNFIKVSVPKTSDIFIGLDKFKEGRLRSARVAEIMVNFINKFGQNKYTWDSEFFYGCKHDFTDIYPGPTSGRTIDIKAHFHPNDRLQISEFSLQNVDADIILSVLVQEDSLSYTATVCGWITKADFTAKTVPWAYNDKIDLRSMEIHELNSPKDLF